MNIIQLLQGKKSYIISALGAVLGILHMMGKIDDGLYQSLLGLLGAGAVTTLAAKINRLNQTVNLPNDRTTQVNTRKLN